MIFEHLSMPVKRKQKKKKNSYCLNHLNFCFSRHDYRKILYEFVMVIISEIQCLQKYNVLVIPLSLPFLFVIHTISISPIPTCALARVCHATDHVGSNFAAFSAASTAG